jgi:acetyltransferase-like isoleucine patch superfamily enzyme
MGVADGLGVKVGIGVNVAVAVNVGSGLGEKVTVGAGVMICRSPSTATRAGAQVLQPANRETKMKVIKK